MRPAASPSSALQRSPDEDARVRVEVRALIANAREQAQGTNPNSAPPLLVDYSIFSSTQGRLSWPANGQATANEIWATTNLSVPFSFTTNVPGHFPETEWILWTTNTPTRYFRVGQAGPR